MLTKTPVIGAVERGGKVKAQVADDLTGKGVLKFIRRNVKSGSSRLNTDEYQACNAVRSTIKHDVIKHIERYVADACYRNIHRHTENVFDVFIRGCFACQGSANQFLTASLLHVEYPLVNHVSQSLE